MDSHDERTHPRPGPEPAPQSAEASVHPLREPAGSGPAQDPVEPTEPVEPAESTDLDAGPDDSTDPDVQQGPDSAPAPYTDAPSHPSGSQSRTGGKGDEGEGARHHEEERAHHDQPVVARRDKGVRRDEPVVAHGEGREASPTRRDQADEDAPTGQDLQDDVRVPAQTGHPPESSTAAGAETISPAASGQGISRLSFSYQVVAAVALAAVAVAACVHLGLVFLSVAPSNTMTKQHGEMVDDWVLPEFEQNWKLFAPNPLQQNIAVQARVEVRGASGSTETTGWYDISALDGAAIDGNPLPSHTQQNELRRAWDFFVSTHDSQNRPIGMRGELSESYLRRIIILRLHRLGVGTEQGQASQPSRSDSAGKADKSGQSGARAGGGVNGTVMRIQIRSMTTNVQPPRWSGTVPSGDKPIYRTLAWWRVTADDMALDAAAGSSRPKDTTTEAISR